MTEPSMPHASLPTPLAAAPPPRARAGWAVASLIASLLPAPVFALFWFLPAGSLATFLSLPLAALVGLGAGIAGLVQGRHARAWDFWVSLIGAILGFLWLGLTIFLIIGLIAMQNFD